MVASSCKSLFGVSCPLVSALIYYTSALPFLRYPSPSAVSSTLLFSITLRSTNSSTLRLFKAASIFSLVTPSLATRTSESAIWLLFLSSSRTFYWISSALKFESWAGAYADAFAGACAGASFFLSLAFSFGYSFGFFYSFGLSFTTLCSSFTTFSGSSDFSLNEPASS